jgi:glycosyltransferase involved in cell wall biosynthesis
MIKIIACFWNASKYIEECINSVKSQSLKDFKMFLIDDVSTDDTVQKIKLLIDNDKRFELIENKEKKFKLKNIDELIRDENKIDNEDIIIELDGDDALAHYDVLNFINNKYINNLNLWLTNGNFMYSDGRYGFSAPVNYKNIRTDFFTFSHLRTWKAHLWKKIEKESFLDENNEYFKSAADVAYSFPMIEMAGSEHYEFVPNVLLIYNDDNIYADNKPHSAAGGILEQSKTANYIRFKKPYKPL